MALEKVRDLAAGTGLLNSAIEVTTGDNPGGTTRKIPAALVQAITSSRLLSRTTAAPPVDPEEGDRYVIAANPTGAWAGHSGEMTCWLLLPQATGASVGAWYFFPAFGVNYIEDEKIVISIDSDGTQSPVFNGGILGLATQFSDGSAAEPSAYFSPGFGFFNDTVNNGIGFSWGGVQSGFWTQQAIHFERPGIHLTEIALVGDAGVRYAAISFRDNTSGALVAVGKGRGSQAVKAVPIIGDNLGGYNFGGYDGASTTNGYSLSCVLIETNPIDNAHMGGQLQLKPTPIGSGTPTQNGTHDYQNGLQLNIPPSYGFGVVHGVATIQDVSASSPGWYAQLIGDAFPRVRIGLNSTDVASLGLGSGAAARDTFIERAGPALLRFGAADAAVPIVQTATVQGVAVGTVDTAGAIWNWNDSPGTGNKQSGGFRWRLHPKGASGSTQNPAVTSFAVQNHDSGVPALLLAVTLFTGDTGTKTVPNFTIQPPAGAAPVTTWDVNGTYCGINAVNGFTGKFYDVRINGGTTIFNVDYQGAIFGKSLTVSDGAVLLTSTAAFANGAGALAGTLTNAPKAGNPDKYFLITDSSGTYAVPGWKVA